MSLFKDGWTSQEISKEFIDKVFLDAYQRWKEKWLEEFTPSCEVLMLSLSKIMSMDLSDVEKLFNKIDFENTIFYKKQLKEIVLNIIDLAAEEEMIKILINQEIKKMENEWLTTNQKIENLKLWFWNENYIEKLIKNHLFI